MSDQASETYKPGGFGCHEALHTAGVAMDLVEASLVEHPAIRANDEWLKLAQAAHQSLFDLYQAIGAEHLPDGRQATREIALRKRGDGSYDGARPRS